MINLYSLLLLTAAAVAYCISQAQIQGKLRWGNYKANDSFWAQDSWTRKYKIHNGDGGLELWVCAPTTYYYKLFNLKYKERFPGSATFLVALTDGYHLMQAIALLSFSAAIAVHYERWVLWTIAYRVVFGITFTIVYKWAGRK